MDDSKNREKIWGDLFEQYQEEKTGQTDYRGFSELFEEKGLRGYDKGEKDFGSPDKSKVKERNFSYAKEPEGKLDLHGEIVADVPNLLEKFLLESREMGKAFVLVICGMGRHSIEGKSKLRPIVIKKLLEMQQNQRVKDFKTAEAKDGGLGAVYVYLK